MVAVPRKCCTGTIGAARLGRELSGKAVTPWWSGQGPKKVRGVCCVKSSLLKVLGKGMILITR